MMMFFITGQMSELLLFCRYFFIIRPDPSLNPLFVSLQCKKLLCKRMLAVVFFVWLECTLTACIFLFEDFPCWNANTGYFGLLKTLKMQGEKEENGLTVPGCNCSIGSRLSPSGTAHTDGAACWWSWCCVNQHTTLVSWHSCLQFGIYIV